MYLYISHLYLHIYISLTEILLSEKIPTIFGAHSEAGDDLYQRGPKRFKKSPFDVLTGDRVGVSLSGMFCLMIF